MVVNLTLDVDRSGPLHSKTVCIGGASAQPIALPQLSERSLPTFPRNFFLKNRIKNKKVLYLVDLHRSDVYRGHYKSIIASLNCLQ